MKLDFTIQPNITQEYILSKITQETIFGRYIKVPIESKKLFCSPLRDDRNPTCSFYKSGSNILYFHDFATNQQLNCFSFVMELYKCDYWKALKIIAQDFGLYKSSEIPKTIKIIPEIKQSKTTNIRCEIKEFSKEELDWWEKFGIDFKLLKKYHVYSIKSVFLNGNLSNITSPNNPIFGYYGGKKDGIELWRIYFPKRKKYRFLSNWNSKKIQGFKELPKQGNLLVITKSMKDCICLNSLGIPAIAPNSETLFITDSVLNDLKERFKNIIIFYDNDRAGKLNMAKIRRAHPELNYFLIPKEYDCKDISDFHKKYKRKKTLEFIKKYILLWQKSRKS